MKYVSLIATLLLFNLQLFAQVEVSGKLTDGTTGEALVGATIVVDGSTMGTTSDFEGEFTLTVPGEDAVLVFNFIGFETQRLKVGSRRIFEVVLQADATELDAVVVTALGLKREKKSLGYSVQDVDGEDIADSNPTNLVAALSGKIAGAQVLTSSGAVGASTTINIRGNKSLSSNAQPLFVVDGIPIMNGISSSRTSTTYTDFGNAAMDIDPSNIESMSILKGASATALYGERASNGVVMITTKKGSGRQGIGVEFTTSLAFDNVYILPNYQNEYGQGVGGSEYSWQKLQPDLTYKEYVETYGFSWATDGTGRQMKEDQSWGGRLDAGLMIPQMDSPVDPVTGLATPTPWISRPDNVKDYFNTGITHQHNLALTAGGEKATSRLSMGYSNQQGTVPNTDQTKINLGLNTSVKLNKRVSFDVNANYINMQNDNLPQQGNSMRNPMLVFNSWFGRQVDTEYLEERYEDIVLYNGEERAFNWMMGYPEQHPNPYWNAYVNTMGRRRNRFYGKATINVELFDGVTLSGGVGTDFFNENRRFEYHQYSRDWTDLYENASNGTLWEQFRLESETNADLMLKINRDFGEDFSLFATLGANTRIAYDRYATTYGQNLVVADFFSTSNFKGEPSVSFSTWQKQVNSVYGLANMGYKDFLYVDLSLRGDWSSTLPMESWNYWYPSATVSFIASEAFNLTSDAISFLKLRGGYALVGSGTGPYAIDPVYYSAGNTTFNGVNLFSAQSTLPTFDLKPELTSSYEFGADLKFFQNRLGLDLTYYDATTYNQLIGVDVPYSSGYSSWFTNAGSIRNNGIELQLYASILRSAEGFNWDVDINWSTNKSMVVELAEGLDELTLTSFYYGNSSMAYPGQPFGDIYGTTFARDSATNEILVNKKGNPGVDGTPVKLGNVLPDWIGGIGNTFTYKGLSLYVLFDFRKGGDVWSMTKAVGQKTGILQNTVEGGIRENGMIVPGIYQEGTKLDLDGDGTREDVSGQPNQTAISAFAYYDVSREFGELAIIDGSYIKLREVNLSYQLPKTLVSRIGLQSAVLSVFGRNLALLYTHESNDVGIDPEVSFGGTLGGLGLEAYQMPSTRTIGVKLSVKF